MTKRAFNDIVKEIAHWEDKTLKLLLTDTNFIISEEVFTKYYSKITTQRQQKVMACRMEADKKRVLAASLLLKYMCDENEIKTPVYEKNHQGKPYITGEDRKIFFNLSHSGEYAVCAYGKQEVGVDIQERRVTSEAMVGRFLNHMEMEDLPEDLTERITIVNRLWCIKESFVKLIGLGLSYDMRDCIVDLNKRHIIDLSGRYDTAYFMEYPLEDEYHLAVSCMKQDLPEGFERITF